MSHRIEDYFPTSDAPNLRVINIDAPPASAARDDPADVDVAMRKALDILVGKRIVALTGAGISTESGLPDYRSPGSRSRHPITLQQFMGEERWRKHYWARNHLGWRGPLNAEPNAGHHALVELENLGVLTGVITQNVDRLHSKAGSRTVVDLHGRYDRVRCTSCDEVITRQELDDRLTKLNPGFVVDDIYRMEIAPDADATVSETGGFVVAGCLRCGGILRTDVVFFGGKVRDDDVQRGRELVDDADALLIAGSSLAVGSAMRFVRQAHKAGKAIVVINRGPTRADDRADECVWLNTSVALPYLAREL